MEALIFDCDGVLVDPERDGHRVAFNQAFAAAGYDIVWGIEEYGALLNISGGKERMRWYFEHHGWPPDISDQDAFVKQLHQLKTDLFMQIIEEGRLPLRTGVKRLVDEAIAECLVLAVCSTANERAVRLIVEKLLGQERNEKFSVILAGDIVSKKKPDPEVYNLAKQHLNLPGEKCIVVEDSRNGLLAAKAAGMHCIITISGYTTNEDFAEADGVFPELGDPPGSYVSLHELKELVDS